MWSDSEKLLSFLESALKNFTERTLTFKTLDFPPPPEMQSSVIEISISFHQNLAKYFEAICKGSFSLSSKVAYKISKNK